MQWHEALSACEMPEIAAVKRALAFRLAAAAFPHYPTACRPPLTEPSEEACVKLSAWLAQALL